MQNIKLFKIMQKYVVYLKFYNPQTPWFKSYQRRPEWEKRTGMVDELSTDMTLCSFC